MKIRDSPKGNRQQLNKQQWPGICIAGIRFFMQRKRGKLYGQGESNCNSGIVRAYELAWEPGGAGAFGGGEQLMYGQNKYGATPYGSGNVPGSQEEIYIDLIPLVPPFITELAEMHELYAAQGYGVGQLRHDLEDVVGQCFIMTATWGLERWEKVFGVPADPSLSYERRREVLVAKLRGQGTTTVQMVRKAAAAFSGGEVEVTEDSPHHFFTVHFTGTKGIPRNMQGFISMLEEIKPAHLAYEFKYWLTTWDELKNFNWNGLRAATWDGIKTMEAK